ncbi:DUF1045 domain-containing protein [Aureimonas pseudogalii]|uniref:Putative phosphonate metabolism protein n=1 Tax=Aureimonas pseudogalii TaxID=1744844 RepID=A0A7W6H4Z3_9HYPH|nr:DUF1045 domain-containing protein [Aureimonas pseudogalii]MBB3998644.1 putative phosphonate metabolism protein [Aureimonas pseudogalii]
MRYAVYYTPPSGTALALAAADWLGRDAFGERVPRAPDARHGAIVAEPARYGFHATLKAPFRLAEGQTAEALDHALATFCAVRSGPRIGSLALARLGSFFAFVPETPDAGIAALEADAVERFEPFRAPLTEAETARRRPDRLNGRQRDHLAQWGYPHVLDQFRFHMTLTGPCDDTNGSIEAELTARFAGFLGRAYVLEGLALFVQPDPDAPFRFHRYHSFAAEAASEPAT